MTTVWGTALVALLAIGALSDWDFVGHAFSAIPVTALLVVYLTLTPRYQFCRPFDIESAIHPLSWRAVSLLLFIIGVETITFGLPSSGIVATLVLGLSKASTWYFLVQSVCQTSQVDLMLIIRRLVILPGFLSRR